MRIEPIEAFTYRGKTFETEAKAVDYAESLVADLIKPGLLARGFTISEWVKVSQVILENREALADLLGY